MQNVTRKEQKNKFRLINLHYRQILQIQLKTTLKKKVCTELTTAGYLTCRCKSLPGGFQFMFRDLSGYKLLRRGSYNQLCSYLSRSNHY